ncbi:MAG: hypothetical protein KAU20_03200 [Nanoarchaeota archaeon]|nr:hypothetical protein [Nanoarchaeota archaeon]
MIIETGDGGDAVLNGNDLQVINGLQNMPYIAMFGGNIEASTVGEKLPNEQAYDWWGNNLLMLNDPSLQFNSDLERLLDNIVLNSSGRLEILSTVKKDLKFMLGFAELEVEVSIVTVDRILIYLKIQEPGNLQSNEYTYIWDSMSSELITE